MFYDIMNKEIYVQQNYSFWKYAPYTALVFHLLFVTHRPVHMKYPHKQLEVNKASRPDDLSLISMLIILDAKQVTYEHHVHSNHDE